MKANKFLDSLRDLLTQNNQPVTEIELTLDNYDDQEKVIEEGVPTLTTDFCEIGVYKKAACYFTIILHSSSFSKELFKLVKDQKGVHIYGFKKFLKDYYPTKSFSFDKLESQVKSEPYFQIQFNFNFLKLTPENTFNKYSEIKETLENAGIKAVNQITKNLGPN